MLIPFDKMPDYARVWVYQTDRNLSDAEAQYIQQTLDFQINNWAAHGAALVGAAAVLHNRFVIVSVDENHNQASGCSIDASTNWLKNLGADMNLNFFDRSIAYLQGDEIKTVEMLKIKALVSEETITPNTLIFNNLVSNIGEFKMAWNVLAGDSWMKRYFQNITA
ncbi:MAG: hypothetical protein U5N85_18080 [Arcicella sp.]|nr:hypothetical protein [Arcicella sp.]